MKDIKLFWLVLGLVLLIVGVVLMGESAQFSIASFIIGFSILILQSIRLMRISGGVKENYFERGAGRSVRFKPDDPAKMEENIWDTLNSKKGEDA